MKVALVTFSFTGEKTGGVPNVLINVLRVLKNSRKFEIEILSFFNSSRNPNSIQLFNPLSYGNSLRGETFYYDGVPVHTFGAIGSEFEILRYRRRHELKNFFNSYDLVIVITGTLQFANIVPRTKARVLVQCATRLKWERESQYRTMSSLRKLLLKAQTPWLLLQEWRVVSRRFTFMPENNKMEKWLASRSRLDPMSWYPGVNISEHNGQRKSVTEPTGHLISVGRFFEARKGWDRLLLAYKDAYDACGTLPDLVVIGWGEFASETNRLLNSLIPDYPIKVMPNLSNLDRDKYLMNSSFFLQTSFEEGLGLAAIEALNFGLPMICSATDGSREYVLDGISGKLISQGPNFIKDFSSAIVDSRSWDYKSLQRESLNLFREKFSEEISEKRLLEILGDK